MATRLFLNRVTVAARPQARVALPQARGAMTNSFAAATTAVTRAAPTARQRQASSVTRSSRVSAAVARARIPCSSYRGSSNSNRSQRSNRGVGAGAAVLGSIGLAMLSASAEQAPEAVETQLYTPLQLGDVKLQHRVVMCPLTRMRADAAIGGVPTELNALYYEQRASPGGLLITEATQISQEGQGYPYTPGIHSEAQIQGWKKVTEAVHKKGGIIFLQLWHTGRVSSSRYQEDKSKPAAAPSAIGISGGSQVNPDFSSSPNEVPRAVTKEEIKRIVADFKQAALNSKKAGFDGVEIHSANGYLLDQFLQDNSNKRTDEYGGSIENRIRFVKEIVKEVVDVFGAGRVGIRFSPFGDFGDMHDSNPGAVFREALREIEPFKLAYVHLVTPRTKGGGTDTGVGHRASRLALQSLVADANYTGNVIAAGGFERESAEAAVQGRDSPYSFADAIAFGRHFISNPDLPQRLHAKAPLHKYDRSTFYGGGASGYTDYPTMDKE